MVRRGKCCQFFRHRPPNIPDILLTLARFDHRVMELARCREDDIFDLLQGLRNFEFDGLSPFTELLNLSNEMFPLLGP